jgi:hypothetical protein
MNIVKEFEYREDFDYGTLGWVLRDAPKVYNTGGPVLVAHDCIEHFTNAVDGSIEDELLALGSVAWIRGDSLTEMNHRYTCGQSLGSDVHTLLRVGRPVENMTGHYAPWESASDYIKEGVEEGVNSYICEEGELTKVMMKQDAHNIKGWMLRGMRFAKRRFHNDKDLALYLFTEVRDQVARVKCMEEGDTLRVSIGIKQQSVNVTHRSIYEN